MLPSCPSFLPHNSLRYHFCSDKDRFNSFCTDFFFLFNMDSIKLTRKEKRKKKVIEVMENGVKVQRIVNKKKNRKRSEKKKERDRKRPGKRDRADERLEYALLDAEVTAEVGRMREESTSSELPTSMELDFVKDSATGVSPKDAVASRFSTSPSPLQGEEVQARVGPTYSTSASRNPSGIRSTLPSKVISDSKGKERSSDI